MKVYISPPITRAISDIYYKWLKLRYKKDVFYWADHPDESLDRLDLFVDKLEDILQSFYNVTINRFIFDKLPINIKYVKIAKHDAWDIDSTLSVIIEPLLKKFKENKPHGAPHVDDSDVPEHLRSTSAPPVENKWDVDELHFERWAWIIDELIWTFEQLNSDWEEQYHSGTTDVFFEKLDDGSGHSVLQHGPNHTHVFDREGHEKHSKRIDNGLRLFGRYYRNLWD